MIERLRALGGLRSFRELFLLARLGAFAAAVPVLMRLPLPRAAAVITSPTRRPAPSDGEVERLDRLMSVAQRAGRPLVRSGCLTRGVTLFWFLRRAGLDVELCFGLDAGDGCAPDGHCWLALDDEPFLERRDPRARFAELYRLPLSPA
jgi:hypothetical protein